jgi:hypothetical protein
MMGTDLISKENYWILVFPLVVLAIQVGYLLEELKIYLGKMESNGRVWRSVAVCRPFVSVQKINNRVPPVFTVGCNGMMPRCHYSPESSLNNDQRGAVLDDTPQLIVFAHLSILDDSLLSV